MNEARRTLLKGMLTSAVMGAIGLPKPSFAATPAAPERMAVLLTGTAMDAMFLAGAEIGAKAGAAGSERPLQTIAMPQRAGIFDPGAVRDFLQAHRGTRVVGLMDDASYVLFSEMARDAGIALLAEGRHGQYAQAVSRHELRVTNSLHGAAEILAAGLARGSDSFAVAELPFAASSALPGRDWSAHGFASYRVAQAQPLCLHLAGLPLASACEALDLSVASAEPVARSLGRPQEAALDGEWPALLGYALCHVGAGCATQAASATQVFLRGDAILGQPGKLASLVSFVVDL